MHVPSPVRGVPFAVVNTTLSGRPTSRHEPLDPVVRHRPLVEPASDVVVSLTMRGRISWISPTVSGLLGWSAQELEGRAMSDLVHGDDMAATQSAHARLDQGHPVDISARLLARNGHYRWIKAHLDPLLDDDGAPAGRVATWHSMTGEAEGIDEGHQCDQTFVLHTSDGVITWVSDSIEQSIGWTREELIGSPSRDFVHPDDQYLLATMRDRRCEGTPYAVRLRLIGKEGSCRWHDVTSTLVSSLEQGEWAVNILRDVTDSLVAAQHREHLTRLMAATVDALPDPHLHLSPVWDELGRITGLDVASANLAACAALRCTREQLVGQSLSGLLPETLLQDICRHAREVVASGTSFVIDDLHLHSDILGEHGLYDIRLMLAGGLLSLTFREVSERHLRYDAVARIRELDVLNAERERVARDLHDGAIQKVFATSLRLAALAAQLPESSRARLEELIDLQDAVIKDLRTTVYQLGTTGWSSGSPSQAMAKTAREASRALGFTPELHVDHRLATIHDATFGHVLFVVREALSNVARHAHAHHVHVSLVLEDSDLVLTVWDDGVGLDPSTPRGDGVGNMERRAQLLGGTCDITSQFGEGTTMEWRVPAPPPPPAHEPSGTQQRVEC